MILLSLILTILFCYWQAKADEAATRYVRSVPFSSFIKNALQDFHKYGSRANAVFVSAIGLLPALIERNVIFFFICFAIGLTVSAFTYWLSFDIFFALNIKCKWYYLGDTAHIDTKLKNILGKYAGVYKAILCALIVAASIYLYFRL